MVIDIIDFNLSKSELQINLSYDFNKEHFKGTEIIDIKDFSLMGSISKYETDDFTIYVRCVGTLVLPSSLTLKEVDIPFSFELDDNLNNLYDEIGQNIKNMKNTLDIFPIIWENILMEIPMKVIDGNEEVAQTSGEGWKFITDDEELILNPELEKLKQLL